MDGYANSKLFKLCQKKINTKFLWKDSSNSKHSQAPFEVRLAALVTNHSSTISNGLAKEGSKMVLRSCAVFL